MARFILSIVAFALTLYTTAAHVHGVARMLWRRPHAFARPPALFFTAQPDATAPTPTPETLKEEEINLQNLLWHIEALEIRNKAQRGSFNDAQHQWDKGNSEEDRQYLLMKPRVVVRLDEVRRLLSDI